MYKITVVNDDREEHEHENIVGYCTPGGALQLEYLDESLTIYAPGTWREATVERVNE